MSSRAVVSETKGLFQNFVGQLDSQGNFLVDLRFLGVEFDSVPVNSGKIDGVDDAELVMTQPNHRGIDCQSDDSFGLFLINFDWVFLPYRYCSFILN